jgi:hypothetical protein
MPRVNKVVPQQFPLAQSAMRVALLAGILAGFVQDQEIKDAVLLDTEPRPHKKPVVAWGIRFDSIILAAEYAKRRFAYTEKRTLNGWRLRIAKMCNQDAWEGFYWAE